MSIYHRKILSRWHNYSIFEQMANIGAEVGRAIFWRKKGQEKMGKNAFYRALELIEFSVDDAKNRNSLKEILRVRELLVDYFCGNNIYHSTDCGWEKYFYHFTLAARNLR